MQTATLPENFTSLTVRERMQIIFSEVVLFSRKRSQNLIVRGDKQCRYRSTTQPESEEYTNCCFIGYFIPDEKYSPDIERKIVHMLYESTKDNGRTRHLFEDIFGKCDENIIVFLAQIQRVHDDFHSEDWERIFESIASDYEEFGVTMPPICSEEFAEA